MTINSVLVMLMVETAKKTFFCFFSASAVAAADVVVALECHSHNDSGSNINLSTKKVQSTTPA